MTDKPTKFNPPLPPPLGRWPREPSTPPLSFLPPPPHRPPPPPPPARDPRTPLALSVRQQSILLWGGRYLRQGLPLVPLAGLATDPSTGVSVCCCGRDACDRAGAHA